MYNPFSFITIFIKKWTDGTRFDFVKMMCSSALFISCIVVLQKWNTVPTFKDELCVTTYRGQHFQNDSLGASIRIIRPYYNFSNLGKNTAEYNIGIIGTYKRDTTEFLRMDKKTETLLAELKNNIAGFNADSTILLLHAKIRMNPINNSASKDNNTNKNILLGNGDAGLIKAYTETKDTAWVCGEIFAAFKQHKSDKAKDKTDPLFFFPNLASSKINIGIGKYTNWFRMEDISQSYYTLNIKSENYDTHIDNIKIDFGGAVRFLHIYPTPDISDYSSIVYNDAEKISYIQSFGLKTYCQLLEASGLQSVRIYLLSAFATFFLGISLKILLEMLWRFCKKRIHKLP